MCKENALVNSNNSEYGLIAEGMYNIVTPGTWIVLRWDRETVGESEAEVFLYIIVTSLDEGEVDEYPAQGPYLE